MAASSEVEIGLAMASELEIERELRRLARRQRIAQRHADEVAQDRDEAIRWARKAGISQRRVMELTGLSRARINQIMRNARL